jgi:hypothetical protein
MNQTDVETQERERALERTTILTALSAATGVFQSAMLSELGPAQRAEVDAILGRGGSLETRVIAAIRGPVTMTLNVVEDGRYAELGRATLEVDDSALQ